MGYLEAKRAKPISFSSQTLLSAKKKKLISDPPLNMGYGMLYIHFPLQTTSKLIGTLDCLFCQDLLWGTWGKSLSTEAQVFSLEESFSACPAIAATKLTYVKSRQSYCEINQSSPFSKLQARGGSSSDPWLYSMLFWNSQMCLDFQETENSMALASSLAQEPLNQLLCSYMSDCTLTTLQCAITKQPVPALSSGWGTYS